MSLEGLFSAFALYHRDFIPGLLAVVFKDESDFSVVVVKNSCMEAQVWCLIEKALDAHTSEMYWCLH